MEKIYISDIIGNKEIARWKPGDNILIESQTGSGKSEFIKNSLHDYCLKNNKRILLLSNRTLLKNQNINDLTNKLDVVSAFNYQRLEFNVLNGSNVENIFNQYDYIVFDEIHYPFSDSTFNLNSSIILDIINQISDKVFVFITATPQALKNYQASYEYTYTLPYDYSYIKDIYFFSRTSVIDSIIQSIHLNEKILYFGSNAKTTLNLSQQYPNSTFICSNNNKLYDYSNKETMINIENLAKFRERILFSTSVLSNGVNLKDAQLKHIVINSSDPISIIQFIGRKRILDPLERITLYLRDYHSGQLYYLISGLEKGLKSKENFKQNNLARYYHHQTSLQLLRPMRKEDSGFQKAICKYLQFDHDKVRMADKVFEKISLLKLMKQYEGIHLFGEKKELFRDKFKDSVFTYKEISIRKRGIRALNAALIVNNICYEIVTRQERKGANRGQRYWMVVKVEKIENEI